MQSNTQTKKMEELTVRNLAHAKPQIRGTTLITYIVPGGMDV